MPQIPANQDKDERFVPVFPRIRPRIDSLPRTDPRVLPALRARQLLARLKAAGLKRSFKVHSLRHHFASMCANHQIAYKKALGDTHRATWYKNSQRPPTR